MRRWIGRILIGVVLLWNVQCAIVFIINPESYTLAFGLNGVTGEAAVRGMGVLFLMWNVPYAVALWDPEKHRLSLYEAITMQTIGLMGETAILWSLPSALQVVRVSILRFILFDGTGLLALLLSAWVTRRRR